MSETLPLDGGIGQIEFARGVRVRAPGLRGTVTLHEPMIDAVATRGLSEPALEEPLAAAGFETLVTLELELEPSGPAPVAEELRGPDGVEALELELPDLSGEDFGQVVLAVDEAGVATWHFPLDESDRLLPATRGGTGGVKRFLVRARQPAVEQESAGPATRGLLGSLGRRVVKGLIYPLTDPVVGRVGRIFARRWEESRRPYMVRSFGPGTFTQPAERQLDAAQWRRLAGDRALLFVHGTFSRCHSAFGGLSSQSMSRLSGHYGDRLFGFDHFTVSEDPIDNVRWFLDQVPENLSLELDVVCHSRGGLVARTLAQGVAGLQTDRVAVKRVVFVAVPNAGTALADPERLPQLLDRFTTVLNLFPDNGVTETLEVILMVVKVLAHGLLRGLPGLASMNPHGDFLRDLNQGPPLDVDYFSLAADFEPRGGLRDLVVDAGADVVFGRDKNDLVVPTLGVYDQNGHPSFPLASAARHQFDDSHGVLHTNFFPHGDAQQVLERWLTS